MSNKCGVCVKSVYPMDPQINLDGNVFHTSCAKCEDCKCQITISNFTKSGTTLLCKTHYFKRFNEQGNYMGGEKFSQKSSRGNTTFTPPPVPSSTTTAAGAPPAAAAAAASSASASTTPAPEESERRKSIQERMKAFGAGSGNQVKCAVCDRTVYPNDPQITLDGIAYHKECAKCSDCNCQITLANFCKFEKTLFCKTHYFKRFSEEGSYLGGDKYAQKSTGTYVAKEASFVPKVSTSESTEESTTATPAAAPAPAPVTTTSAPAPASEPSADDAVVASESTPSQEEGDHTQVQSEAVAPTETEAPAVEESPAAAEAAEAAPDTTEAPPAESHDEAPTSANETAVEAEAASPPSDPSSTQPENVEVEAASTVAPESAESEGV